MFCIFLELDYLAAGVLIDGARRERNGDNDKSFTQKFKRRWDILFVKNLMIVIADPSISPAVPH
jgi:hypothetical protein